jgi:hypothetical protein
LAVFLAPRTVCRWLLLLCLWCCRRLFYRSHPRYIDSQLRSPPKPSRSCLSPRAALRFFWRRTPLFLPLALAWRGVFCRRSAAARSLSQSTEPPHHRSVDKSPPHPNAPRARRRTPAPHLAGLHHRQQSRGNHSATMHAPSPTPPLPPPPTRDHWPIYWLPHTWLSAALCNGSLLLLLLNQAVHRRMPTQVSTRTPEADSTHHTESGVSHTPSRIRHHDRDQTSRPDMTSSRHRYDIHNTNARQSRHRCDMPPLHRLRHATSSPPATVLAIAIIFLFGPLNAPQ